jgi:hypothetical protein
MVSPTFIVYSSGAVSPFIDRDSAACALAVKAEPIKTMAARNTKHIIRFLISLLLKKV